MGKGETGGERRWHSRVGCHKEQRLSSPFVFQLFVLPASIAPRQELGKAFSGLIPQLFGWGIWGRTDVGAGGDMLW